MHYPYGANLTALQFLFSALIAMLIKVCGVADVDRLEWTKVKAFLPAVAMFYVSVAANLKLLQHANVDTYIVVRACVPLLTLFLDVNLMGAAWPGWKTLSTMLFIVFSACGYIYTDEGFVWAAYLYALLYLAAMSIDTILIKKVVEDVKLTRWGLVFYNNFLALGFFPFGSLLTGDISFDSFESVTQSIAQLGRPDVMLPVGVSCVVGVAISYFGLNTRKALTATSFTVLGVVNKFLTVLVNTLVWSRHAGPLGIFFVVCTIVGGIAYQKVMGSDSITKRPPTPTPVVEKEVPLVPEPTKIDIPQLPSAEMQRNNAAMRSKSTPTPKVS